jgi:hypothetical protein
VLCIVNSFAEQYDIQLECDFPEDALQKLLVRLHQQTGQKVVVLVDEYDKPILDNITNPDRATQSYATDYAISIPC